MSRTITNARMRFSVYSQRWQSAVQAAHEGHPLIGISTSRTILSLARYRPGSIKSPIPWRASRWLRLHRRPRAHQSEPAPNRVDIGFLACIVIAQPTKEWTMLRRRRRRRLRCWRQGRGRRCTCRWQRSHNGSNRH